MRSFALLEKIYPENLSRCTVGKVRATVACTFEDDAHYHRLLCDDCTTVSQQINDSMHADDGIFPLVVYRDHTKSRDATDVSGIVHRINSTLHTKTGSDKG